MVEIERGKYREVKNLISLKEQLDKAIINGAQEGDLTRAWKLRRRIESKIIEIELKKMATYQVEVNYDLTIEEQLSEGDFGEISPGVDSQKFDDSMSGTVKLEIYLFNKNECLSNPGVIAALQRLGLRPANLKELLCLARQHAPKKPILALGSHGKDEEVIGFDNSLGDKLVRMFGGYYGSISNEDPWPRDWCFAAVKI